LALCISTLGGCSPRGVTTTPAEEPSTPAPDTPLEAVPTTTTTSTPPAETTPIRAIADFKRVIEEQFAGRVDASRGVVFIDIYDDEGEESKPIAATRLCGSALDELPTRWAAELSARLQDSMYQDARYLSCEGERCWHEALEAGDHRGLYLFEQGTLQAVVWTSGPPGHVTNAYLTAEDEFVATALDALRDAPCGERYTGALTE